MTVEIEKIEKIDEPLFIIWMNHKYISGTKEDLEELQNMINAELHELTMNNLDKAMHTKYDDNKYDYLNKEGE